MTGDLATKLRLLAADIDDAGLLIDHVEARRELVRRAVSPVEVPDQRALEMAPAPEQIPDWAQPGAPPLTHWQRWSLTYLFIGVVTFVLAALFVITASLSASLQSASDWVATHSTAIGGGLGLLILLGLAVIFGGGGGGRRFTFEGTGRLFR
jgi:hypothetical protein